MIYHFQAVIYSTKVGYLSSLGRYIRHQGSDLSFSGGDLCNQDRWSIVIRRLFITTPVYDTAWGRSMTRGKGTFFVYPKVLTALERGWIRSRWINRGWAKSTLRRALKSPSTIDECRLKQANLHYNVALLQPSQPTFFDGTPSCNYNVIITSEVYYDRQNSYYSNWKFAGHPYQIGRASCRERV